MTSRNSIRTIWLLFIALLRTGNAGIPQLETFGGTAGGTPCVFPYFYNGVWNFRCVQMPGDPQIVCGTTPEMDTDGLYAYCKISDCRESVRSREYTGTYSMGNNGDTCQRWDSQTPWAHGFTNPAAYPDDTLTETHNYCRNPDNDGNGLWCFVVHPYRPWDYCSVAQCSAAYWCEEDLQDVVVLEDFTASSEDTDRAASNARVSQVTGWCADPSDTHPYLQIDFTQDKVISYIETLGEADHLTRRTTEYIIQFLSHDGVTWAIYSSLEPGYTQVQIYDGNVVDTSTTVGYGLHPAIWTRSIRIQPTSWAGNAPCLRVAVVGCDETPSGFTPKTCQNGGTSVLISPSETACYCTPAYVGDLCQTYVTACMTQLCENGGTCVPDSLDPVNVRACQCVDVYSGDACEIGYATSCTDIVNRGGNITGLYSMKLFDTELTQPCTMDTVTIQQAWSIDDTSVIPTTSTMQDCLDDCLADKTCAFVLYEPVVSDCYHYTRDNATDTTITSSLVSMYLLVVKNCAEVVKLHCDLTDTTAPVLTIAPHAHEQPFVPQGHAGSHYLLYMGISSEQFEILHTKAYCSQYVYVKCQFNIETDKWWLGSPQVTSHDLFTSAMPSDSWCDCVFTESCSIDGDLCACNTAAPYTDDGVIESNNLIPVVSLTYEGPQVATTQTSTVHDMVCVELDPPIDECNSSPCANGGTCYDQDFDYECVCVSGYTGRTCTIEVFECLSYPCQHGSTCIDLIDSYFCACVPGYEGTDCEININECSSNPCSSQSSCVDEVNSYRCLCQNGFIGEGCEIDVDECVSSPCRNGGSCTEGVGMYTCDCTDIYHGTNCLIAKNFCDSDPCQYGATCVPFVGGYGCVCVPGYTGDNCQTDIDDCVTVPCENSGVCTDGVDSYSCACLSGYSGLICETDLDECLSDPCENGAECVDGADEYQCLCIAGYSGVNCQTDNDECASTPCLNGATCADLINGYGCVCAEGYQGPTCASDINECLSSPCENEGTCVDERASFTCHCFDGFSGELCELLSIDGQWAGWGEWGDCSNQCGAGVGLRTRQCTNPPPQNGGNPCDGVMRESKDCVQFDCDNVNGNWGPWSDFSPCDATCGSGVQTRTRLCNSPAPTGTGRECEGDSTSQSRCTTLQCGIPRAGHWTLWGEWGDCSTTCGLGRRSRTRRCDSPPPVYGGADCVGDATGYRACHHAKCPDTPECDDWSEWSPCSATCGDGTQWRTRTCHSVPGEADGLPTGVVHTKVDTQTQHCEVTACSVMKCYHCEAELDFSRGQITCKGAAEECPKSKPYCLYAFSDSPSGGEIVRKGCADAAQCGQNVTGMCKTLQDLTISSTISESYNIPLRSLEPHEDTIRMGLAETEDCNICCTTSKCNRGLLPPGNAVYTAGGAIWRMSVNLLMLPVTIALVFS